MDTEVPSHEDSHSQSGADDNENDTTSIQEVSMSACERVEHPYYDYTHFNNLPTRLDALQLRASNQDDNGDPTLLSEFRSRFEQLESSNSTVREQSRTAGESLHAPTERMNPMDDDVATIYPSPPSQSDGILDVSMED